MADEGEETHQTARRIADQAMGGPLSAPETSIALVITLRAATNRMVDRFVAILADGDHPMKQVPPDSMTNYNIILRGAVTALHDFDTHMDHMWPDIKPAEAPE